MKIKVCGLTNNQNIKEISALKPDYMGFIFYKPSPRDVSINIDALDLDSIPVEIRKVAVFVNASPDAILHVVARYRFDLVQLHGDETPGMCHRLKSTVGVIKAFRLGERLPESIHEYEGCCDFFLFDSAGRHYGGNGFAFDHTLLDGYKGNTPFFLSGGISPNDTEFLSSCSNPLCHAVDINSRFETRPGLKNVNQIKTFINSINR
jgi:phosphoribosylanthranilate isomerase